MLTVRQLIDRLARENPELEVRISTYDESAGYLVEAISDRDVKISIDRNNQEFVEIDLYERYTD